MISLQQQECFRKLMCLGVRATTVHTPTELSNMIHGFHGDLDPKIKFRLKIPLFQRVQMLKGPASWRGLGQPPSPEIANGQYPPDRYENPKIILTFALIGFPQCLVPFEQGSRMKTFQSTHRCLRILLAASANISTCFVFAVGKVITALENLLRRENSSFLGTMLGYCFE